MFIGSTDAADQTANRIRPMLDGTPYSLKMSSNRGTVVRPATGGSMSSVDHFRYRFIIADQPHPYADSVLDALRRVGQEIRLMHVEKLERHSGDGPLSGRQTTALTTRIPKPIGRTP